MEAAGERLKKIRLEKGLSLEEVHKKTKIHLDILEALEEDRLINMVPIYVKGFLKIYCEFLGVNPGDFIVDFKRLDTGSDFTKTYQKSILPQPSVKLSMFRPNSKIVRILVLVILLIILGTGITKLVKSIKNKKHSVVLLDKKDKKEKINPAANQVQIPLETIRMGIRARQDCWIKTKVDGKVTFADVLRKGRFESWQAKEKIELSLGNAGGIDLEVNGKLISPLGRKGQVIKHIEITKEEGLKIVK
jgi:transcriptional regulator with XRE-family HTH domain